MTTIRSDIQILSAEKVAVSAVRGVRVLVPTSTLGSHVGLIVGNAAKGQVIGIDTHANIAPVHNHHARRNRTMHRFVGCSVSVDSDSVDGHSTVANTVGTACGEYAGVHGLTAYPMKGATWAQP